MWYDLLKKCVSIFFNLLSRVLGGQLPPLGSAAVIVEEHDYYLVVELPGERVVFPGGFMHWRETPQQAAVREGYEETGLNLRVGGLVNYYSLASSDITNMSTLSFVFQAESVGGILCKNIEGCPRWMHERELRTRLTAHSLTILNDYLLMRALQRSMVAV